MNRLDCSSILRCSFLTTLNRKRMTLLLRMVAPLLFCLTALLTAQVSAALPNIVIILADDMGWGDPKCNNPDSNLATPNIDRLAKEGMRFTDAHAPASWCTPTPERARR